LATPKPAVTVEWTRVPLALPPEAKGSTALRMAFKWL